MVPAITVIAALTVVALFGTLVVLLFERRSAARDRARVVSG